ncbi:hypothetical protein FH972_017156 [Carpinus fangiana]|uniref:Uncharacterized protein n=1 Tax=Carpinus fangiana TaxID=176857 RepID=A0A5N6RI44_9ROSI|nr:hypothetical protein FH972_017156 [Carpinus fangiana]
MGLALLPSLLSLSHPGASVHSLHLSPESSSNRKPQRKQNIPFIALTRERERRHRVRRERETRVTKPPSSEIHLHACCWCFTVSMHESSG